MVYNTKKAAQGIGTLIIFIAMILVAAVAAGVLIQTASSLQSKSLDVGRQSQERITTDIEVVQVFARDTSDGAMNGGSDNVTLVVRLGSGSSPVNFEDLIIRFDASGDSQTTTFNESGAGTVAFDEESYGVRYLIGGDSSGDYLVAGDMAEVYFTVKNGINITESDEATIRLVSKNGAVKPVDITTPSSMVDVTTYLFP